MPKAGKNPKLPSEIPEEPFHWDHSSFDIHHSLLSTTYDLWTWNNKYRISNIEWWISND